MKYKPDGTPMRVYCSFECKGNYQKTSMLGKNNINWKPKIPKNCKNCERLYSVFPYESKSSNFCSKKCIYGYKTKNGKVGTACHSCTRLIVIKRSKYEQNKNVFCSFTCFSSWQKGNNHPLFEDKKMELICKCCNKTYLNYVSNHRSFCSKICSVKYQGNTSIELKLKKHFETYDIQFKEQVCILIDKPSKYTFVDFLIEPNIVVYADGCYWHGCSTCKIKKYSIKTRNEKDNRINRVLEEKGYVVLRFWEHELKKDIGACLHKIKQAIALSSPIV